MKRLFLLGGAILTFSFVMAQKPAATKTMENLDLKDMIDSFSYAVGLNVAHSIRDQGADAINIDLVKKGFEDVFISGNPELSQEQAMNIIQGHMQKLASEKLVVEKKKGTEFLAKNAKKPGVKSLPNGLQYEVITSGDPNGVKPKPENIVNVDYVGTLIDGTEFDSSIKRGEPAEFPLNGVIKGWTEILQLMTKGDKWKVYIPSDLAYGDRGAGQSIPGGATLIFEITLHDIKPGK